MADLPQIVDLSNPEAIEAGIGSAVAALQGGALVGMPTETVYGLAADATSNAALTAIFAAKSRPRFNPLIIHVISASAAEALGEFTPGARRLARAFWPGPLTLVLPQRKPSPVADLATAGLDTIALRVPAHPIARALIGAFGKPIAAPSANRSGHVSPTTAAHVAADLGDRVAVILDAGPTGIGLESTIVGFGDGGPRLLRSGGLPRDDVERILGGQRISTIESDAMPAAPGMLRSHYAPAAKLRLDVIDVRPGEALLAFGPQMPPGAEMATACFNLSQSGDLAEAAARFFAALRDLDAKSDVIAVAPIPDSGLGEAINDRLRRAAAPRG
jgi:L-threonylcarbamoyladenylate synthase